MCLMFHRAVKLMLYNHEESSTFSMPLCFQLMVGVSYSRIMNANGFGSSFQQPIIHSCIASLV